VNSATDIVSIVILEQLNFGAIGPGFLPRCRKSRKCETRHDHILSQRAKRFARNSFSANRRFADAVNRASSKPQY
jgi:hypothetical protein